MRGRPKRHSPRRSVRPHTHRDERRPQRRKRDGGRMLPLPGLRRQDEERPWPLPGWPRPRYHQEQHRQDEERVLRRQGPHHQEEWRTQLHHG
eukprot:10916560-Alexandrium_andersonii.AAC.1